MEDKNISTAEAIKALEPGEVVQNLGACYVIDDNPKNTDVFHVTSDEDTRHRRLEVTSDSDRTLVGICPDERTPNVETEVSLDGRLDLTSVDKSRIDIGGGPVVSSDYENQSHRLNEGYDLTTKNKQKRRKRFIAALSDGTQKPRHQGLSCQDGYVDAICNCIPDDQRSNIIERSDESSDNIPNDGFVVEFDDVLENGYEGDVESRNGGESSGNVTDSDTETKKTLAEKAKAVVQKAIARMDSITEEEVSDDFRQGGPSDEDSDTRMDSITEVSDDVDQGMPRVEASEPGSSCTDTTDPAYTTTDLEKDTGIPRSVLYKVLGREPKSNNSTSNKRKLSTDEG